MELFYSIYWVPVLVSTIAYYILGGIWFSPSFFQKQYDEAMDFTRKNWKPDGKFFWGPLVGCFVISLATSIILINIRPVSLLETIAIGLVLGLGFALSISLINSITPKVRSPLLLGLITGTYHTLGIILTSIVTFFFI